jgi:hypothetical protein
MKHQLFILAISLLLVPILGNSQSENFEFSFNLKNNFQTSYLNSIVESNSNIVPTIGFRVKNSNISILDKVNWYLGFDYKNIKISGTTDISVDGDVINGDVIGNIGGLSPIIGMKYLLTNNDTRPYINAHYRLYMPRIKTDGEVEVDGDVYSWDTSSLSQVFRNIIGVNSTELGFGVEHKINDNLAIFGEYNINFFTVKINVPDADDFIDDVNDALEDAFGGVNGIDIDPIDFSNVSGGGKAKIKYSSSYASLGLSFYF